MDLQPAGPCAECGGPVVCRYNHFEKPGLAIDSWEHKCSDCGKRHTQAFRQEGEAARAAENAAGHQCPYCGRTAEP
jgi:DNA-directed RNA polymerase subunit RPC12/RpoP